MREDGLASPRLRGAACQKKSKEQEHKLTNPKVLFKGMLPPGWSAISPERFAAHGFEAVLADRDPYNPDEMVYFSGFRPPPGFMKTLPNLKAI